ncbi:DUF2938 domain-containing protein [Actibacterium pelagium]|nr:DUF2938 domain-containing protein [Actibacterium pelagium]
MDLILVGILMGIGGTFAMDVLAWTQSNLGVAPFPNWAMPGRWAVHVTRGTLFHEAIAEAEEVPNELTIGWLFHYAVGIAYGLVFIAIAGAGWLAAPGFVPVWIFSLITIAAGWFLLQPGMGLGWAASKTPSPWKVRGLGLLAHTVFGLGMWVVALLA